MKNLKAKCTKSLYMRDGAKCFTKDRSYRVFTDSRPEYIALIDNKGCFHKVLVDGWMEHFKVLQPKPDKSILKEWNNTFKELAMWYQVWRMKP